MRKVFIGSIALKYWFPNIDRKINDIDYAVDVDNVKRDKGTDIVTEYLYNPIIFKYIEEGQEYITPVQLLTLKMSHISWNVNFKKHMYDIQFLLKEGVRYDSEMYNELFEYWTIVKTRDKKYRRSDLTLNSEEFFDNGIISEHDYLHTLLKEVPTYTKVLKDGSEVEPSEEKFLQLSFEDKISVIEEEVMVMAYERFRHKQYRVAYDMMLQKFITGHAPIWQLIFIIENYMQIRVPSMNYYKRIEQKIN